MSSISAIRTRQYVLCIGLLLAVPCFAAANESPAPKGPVGTGEVATPVAETVLVGVVLKNPDGSAFMTQARLWALMESDPYSREKGTSDLASNENGAMTLHLKPGCYVLWLEPDARNKVPGRIWRDMEVKENQTIWNLTVPLMAAVQGRILSDEGLPLKGRLVSVSTKSLPLMPPGLATANYSRHGDEPWNWVFMARGAQHAYAITRTAEDGTFTLSGLAPGNYTLEVAADTKKMPSSFFKIAEQWFTTPVVSALEADAKEGKPTQMGDWKAPRKQNDQD